MSLKFSRQARFAVLVVLGVFFAISGFGQQAGTFIKARIAAINASSQSNMKQLSTALTMYVQDYDETFPPMKTAATTWKLLVPYTKNKTLSQHPYTKEPYIPNPALTYMTLAKIDDPGAMVMLFESRPAPDGTRAVAFADGHVQRIQEKDWPALRKASKIPDAIDRNTTAWQIVLPAGLPADMTPAERIVLLDRRIEEISDKTDTNVVVNLVSLQKLARLGWAIQEYLDILERYPTMNDVAAYQQALRISANPNVYVHPRSGLFYLPNPSLSNKKAEAVSNPEKIVAFYEAEAASDGMRGVAYADGHVGRIAEKDWPALKKFSGITMEVRPSTFTPAADAPAPHMVFENGLAVVFKSAQVHARQASSDSNLRQIALGETMLIQDSDEKFGHLENAAVFKQETFPYVKNNEIYLDPQFHLPYQPNPRLSGKALAKIDMPAESILLFEARPFPASSEETGETRAVAYVDGHVTRLPEGVFQRICAEQNIPIPPIAPLKTEPLPFEPGHPLYAVFKHQQEAISLQGEGKTLDAIALMEKAVAEAAALKDPDPGLQANLLVVQGRMRKEVGDYQKAVKDFEQAMSLIKPEGEKRPQNADMGYYLTIELALLRMSVGDTAQAAAELERASGLRPQPGDTPVEPGWVTLFQNDLSYVYFAQGRLGEVEALVRNAEQSDFFQIADEMLARPTDINMLPGVGVLATFLQPYRQTRDFLFHVTGREKDGAQLDLKLAAYQKVQIALNLFQALAEGEPAQNREFIATFDTLFKAVEDYRLTSKTGMQTADTEALYELLGKAAGQLGTDNPISLLFRQTGLTTAYLKAGRYQDAEKVSQQAVEGAKRIFGADSPNYANALISQALAQAGQGQNDRAEANYRLGLATLARRENTQSQDYARGLQGLAALYTVTQRSDKALETLQEVMRNQQISLDRYFSFSSEAAMQEYLKPVSDSQDMLLSLALEQKGQNGAAATAAFEWTLRRKGILLNTLMRFRQSQELQASDPEIARKASLLRQERQRLNNRELNTPPVENRNGWERETASLRQEIERLETDLHTLLARKSPEGSGEQVDNRAVRAKLPPQTAYVDFVRVTPMDFKQIFRAQARQPARYIAFVLPTDKNAPPQMLDLGAAEELENAVQAMRKHLDHGDRSRPDNRITGADLLSTEERCRADCHLLYQKVFAPLKAALGDAATVYLAPDGELNRVPFEALVDDKQEYLIRTYRFAYLSTGRDLLQPVSPVGKGTVVFAGPDYDLNAGERQQKAAPLVADLKADQQKELASRHSRDWSGVTWHSLAGARAEAKDVEQALSGSGYGPVKAYVGPEALEEVLKSVRSPRILHLATHGFYLPNQKTNKAERTLEPAQPPGGSDSGGLTRLQLSENPLLRSGFVLAGANRLSEMNLHSLKVEDGWVTAEEVSQMNLRGTELVVLSACETGLGDVRAGEGVYGLRRAFLYAGARTLVTSLFSVPDRETQELMQGFYTHLRAGKGKMEALHLAQLALMDARRDTKLGTHPYYWASFVLVGDPN